jgi:hypothetical protein
MVGILSVQQRDYGCVLCCYGKCLVVRLEKDPVRLERFHCRL